MFRSKEELSTKAAKMQAFLESEVGPDPNSILERIEHLHILIAQSGHCLAEAKYIQDQLINQGLESAINMDLDKKLSPSLISKFVGTQAKEINYLVNFLDRINASATHQLDGLRSIISYKKAELNL